VPESRFITGEQLVGRRNRAGAAARAASGAGGFRGGGLNRQLAPDGGTMATIPEASTAATVKAVV
jgi:hypothetical protein